MERNYYKVWKQLFCFKWVPAPQALWPVELPILPFISSFTVDHDALVLPWTNYPLF